MIIQVSNLKTCMMRGRLCPFCSTGLLKYCRVFRKRVKTVWDRPIECRRKFLKGVHIKDTI